MSRDYRRAYEAISNNPELQKYLKENNLEARFCYEESRENMLNKQADGFVNPTLTPELAKSLGATSVDGAIKVGTDRLMVISTEKAAEIRAEKQRKHERQQQMNEQSFENDVREANRDALRERGVREGARVLKDK